MKSKYSIPIKKDEKELYRIFKDLEKYGRTTFSYPDSKKQQGIARSIGIRAKHLFKQDLMLPPAMTRQHRINIVALPTNVQIVEKKTPNGFRFYFSNKKTSF